MRAAGTNIHLSPVWKQEDPAKIRGETIAHAELLLVSEAPDITATSSGLPYIEDRAVSKETPFLTTPIKRRKPPRVVMQKLLLKTLRRRLTNVEWTPSTDSDPAVVQISSPSSANRISGTIGSWVISGGTIGTRTRDLVPKLLLEHALAIQSDQGDNGKKLKNILEAEEPKKEVAGSRENQNLLEALEERPEVLSLVNGSTIGVENLSVTQLPKKLLREEPATGIEDLSRTQFLEEPLGDESVIQVESLSLTQFPEKLLEPTEIEDLSLPHPIEKQFGGKPIIEVGDLTLTQFSRKPLGEKHTMEIEILSLSQNVGKTLEDESIVQVENISHMGIAEKPLEEGEGVDIEQQHLHSQNYNSSTTAAQVTLKVLRHPVAASHRGARGSGYLTTSRRRSTEFVHLGRTINRKMKTRAQPKIVNKHNVENCLTDKIFGTCQATDLGMEYSEEGTAMELAFPEDATVPTSEGNFPGLGIGCQPQLWGEQGTVVDGSEGMDGVEISAGSGAHAPGHGGKGKRQFENGKPATS